MPFSSACAWATVYARDGETMNGTDQARDGRSAAWPRLRPGVVGSLLAVYGLWGLVRIPSLLRSPVFPLMTSAPQGLIKGPLAALWSLGFPWSAWIEQILGWVTDIAFVVGGISIILRRASGTRIALVGVVIEMISLAQQSLFAVSLALGWVVFDLSQPVLQRFGQLPRGVQQASWWLFAAFNVVEFLIFVAAFVWLRRGLDRWRLPDSSRPS